MRLVCLISFLGLSVSTAAYGAEVLKPGDEIELGTATMTFELE